MLIFRDEVHLDTCYLLVVLERSKMVAKGLCYPIERRFFWRWPRGDWTRDANVPGPSSPGHVLPAGCVQKVENGR